jgi:hypothetical protein
MCDCCTLGSDCHATYCHPVSCMQQKLYQLKISSCSMPYKNCYLFISLARQLEWRPDFRNFRTGTKWLLSMSALRQAFQKSSEHEGELVSKFNLPFISRHTIKDHAKQCTVFRPSESNVTPSSESRQVIRFSPSRSHNLNPMEQVLPCTESQPKIILSINWGT